MSFENLLNSENLKGLGNYSNFLNEKKNCLNKIDKSKIQGIDKNIKKLVDLLNSKKEYYTTSSCSGRILLIEKKTDKKTDTNWILVSHNKTPIKNLEKALTKLPKGDIWLRQESMILHICCIDLDSATKLLKIIRDLGIKRAGIINIKKRIILEIIGTESMETIIAREGKLLIENNYLKLLVNEANKKLERNQKKIDELYQKMKSIS